MDFRYSENSACNKVQIFHVIEKIPLHLIAKATTKVFLKSKLILKISKLVRTNTAAPLMFGQISLSRTHVNDSVHCSFGRIMLDSP